jgi:hypothetical protein
MLATSPVFPNANAASRQSSLEGYVPDSAPLSPLERRAGRGAVVPRPRNDGAVVAASRKSNALVR